MHAYLIVGRDRKLVENKVDEQIKKLGLRKIDIEVKTIDEARQLKRFINISPAKPTGIVIREINKSSLESLNSLLKSIEEPPPGFTFILTTPNQHEVIDTIVSRCKIIFAKGDLKEDYSEIKKFLDSGLGQKFIKIDSIKEREEALNFCEQIIKYFHHQLHNEERINYPKHLKLIKVSTRTHKNLSKNGNISLNLSLLSAQLNAIMESVD